MSGQRDKILLLSGRDNSSGEEMMEHVSRHARKGEKGISETCVSSTFPFTSLGVELQSLISLTKGGKRKVRNVLPSHQYSSL